MINRARNPHERFMNMALGLALKAKGRTSPNPMVGALLVKNGRTLGSGYHKKAGMPHAEIEALKNLGALARGADLYVNLEPCCHTGNTPPCCDAIIKSGVKRVIVGMQDPNPLVAGKGIERLKNAGIKTVTGVLEEKSKQINEIFIKYITSGNPFVTLKAAASLDGKIALSTGHSKWITGKESRLKGHELRNGHDAIMVGVNTIIKDDPSLTARTPGKTNKDPIRIILDSSLKIPENSKILNTGSKLQTIIATTEKAGKQKAKLLEKKGARIIYSKASEGKVDIKALMVALGKMEITSVLIEGGAEVNASALNSGVVDKVAFFFAPKIIGGVDSIPIFGQKGAQKMGDIIPLRDMEVSRTGEDIMVTGYVYGNY